MATIIIIDDDMAMETLVENLGYRGHVARRITSSSDALEKIEELIAADLIVLDIIMPWPIDRYKPEVSGSFLAGMEIYKELRKHRKNLPIIVFSVTSDKNIIDSLKEDSYATFIPKWGIQNLTEFIQQIYKILSLNDYIPLPVPFIVHGHNEVVKLSLKNYLQNILKLPEPIILHEQPDQGRTIIEKFELHAIQSSLVFVLLTPDDLGAQADQPNEVKRRARQNVIFEMGFFLGMLGRISGRVILLHQGPIELPSDLSGIIYIDITNGIEAAGEQIRREIKNVL